MWQPGGSSSACPGCRMGQHVPRQGWGGISTHPGQLAQKGPKIAHTNALQAQWSFIPWWSLCRDCRNPNPSGICLSGTASPQAGGPGDSDRPELEAALLRGCLWDCPRIPVLPMGLPEPARSEQSLPRGTGLGILCWGHPMAALHLSLHHSVLRAHSSPLLNSHTSASSLLSNHLHHQIPLTPQQQSHLWPCQLLLPLAERQRTLGRRNQGWEERGKEPGKSFTPQGFCLRPEQGEQVTPSPGICLVLPG